MKHLLLLLSFVLILTSCKNDDISPPNCGCESKTLSTIKESDNFVGKLSFKKSFDPDDSYYNNHYWIGTNGDGAVQGIYIICNEQILKENGLDITQEEVVEVKFSGHTKEVCEKKIDKATITYKRITLTSIERR